MGERGSAAHSWSYPHCEWLSQHWCSHSCCRESPLNTSIPQASDQLGFPACKVETQHRNGMTTERNYLPKGSLAFAKGSPT